MAEGRGGSAGIQPAGTVTGLDPGSQTRALSDRQPAANQIARKRARLSYFGTVFWGYVGLALLVFTFLVPPFQKNDEPSHYYRAVSITNLDFFCQKDDQGQYYSVMKRKYFDLPYVLGADAIWASLEAKFSPSVLRTDFSGARFQEPLRVYSICNLSPVGYAPNALGLLAGKPFANPMIGFYLGRMAGVAFFVGCLIAALRIVPRRYNLIICFYAALPMVLHQVSSFSYDAVQLSLIPLIFAYMTRFLVQEGEVRRSDLLIFMGLLWLTLSVRSFAYYGLLLVYFAVPAARIARDRGRYFRLTGAFLAVTALSIGLLESIFLSRSGLGGSQDSAVDAKEQLRFTLEHPLDFVAACYRTLQVNGEVLLRQAAGVFGWVGFEVNAFAIYLVAVLGGLVCYYVIQRDQPLLRAGHLAVLWAAIFVTAGSLFFSMYAVWSPVGAPIISGLQGRYFLALAPFGMLAVSQTAGVLGAERSQKLLAVAVAAAMLLSIVIAIHNRYY